MPYTTTRVDLGDRSYNICTGTGLVLCQDGAAADLLRPFLQDRRVLAVMDENVARLHGEACLALLRSVPAAYVADVVLTPGEAHKTLSAVEQICNAACEHKLDRGSIIVGIGGGIVGDLAAFAASVYMRGIDCIQVPTSLLAMLDSSVGGKTGADLPGGKNLVGTFYQPKLVLMDPLFLKTLPLCELRNGIAELIKHAVLFDPELFDRLSASAEKLFSPVQCAALEQLIVCSVQWKAAVVMRDEREHGDRKLLNLGHSFGHAVEKETHYTGYRHGEAVAIGMIAAAQLAELCGLAECGLADRIAGIVRAFGLPEKTEGLTPAPLLHAMYSDKKNRNGNLCLILPCRIGKCEIRTDIPESLVLRALEAICG